ncbi:DUF748 domain-containing protein [Pseudomonas sp. PA27(2017)]|uniref:DUF748 domain-containing protein n=1 Tax=Pseudomonas sp. PA27(2017) TaxID=1932112 RepID=UPI00095F0B7E|nr:DUF748 domain-containing protein [Pseudomonas sp. PA27(2017)]OLU29855.1 hypothetical protein BVH06_15875 [Pseudomonas sp. PA27(2017)]
MPKGLRRAATALLIALGLYSLIGFLILPGVALRIANQQLENYATQPARLDRLQLNPFTLELKLWGLHLGEPGKEQVAFEHLAVDLQLDSLWSGALHLANVSLVKPHTEVRFDKDGTLNLAQLFKLPPSEPKPDEPSEPFPLRIDRIELLGGNLRFQDLRPQDAIDIHYDDLNLELHNLSTLPDDNADMTLVATGPAGGRIDWSGELSLSPFSSSGTLKITDEPMQAFWPYVRDAVPLVLEQGVVNLSTDYRLDLRKGTELTLSNARIKAAPFAMKTPDGKPLVKLQSLEVSEASLDLAKQQVVIGKVRGQTLEAWANREKDGELDWQKLFAGEPRPAPAQAPTDDGKRPSAGESDSQAQPATKQPAKPWQVQVKDVQLRDYHAHLVDRVPDEELAVELGPLDLDMQNFDSLGTSPFTLKLDTGVGKQGKLQAEGQVQPSPTTASLKVATRNIDMRTAQAYISPFVHLELRSGLLSSDLDVALTGTEPLALRVQGKAQVTQLHTLDTLKERDLLRWKQLDLGGIDYRHGERLDIERVDLEQPYARFIINEDLTTNVNELIIKQPAGNASQAKASADASADKPLAIRIGEVSLKDGSANFADFSLRPNFATAVQQLNGRIGTLDSTANKAAPVNITGKVDRYAPVSIKGSLTPFDPLQSLDIATQFRQVELTTLTPYSGKFAGYRIRKGRLNLDLHYRINDGKLNADNKVLVEQLQLGEKVDSPDAVDLPIRLAVALLKDTQGRISLELPLQGNLNDPQFSVMPIVWQTLRNLVLRAAQAPFKFIGGLVSGGSDMDLSTVLFAPGSAELDGQARQALDTLASALRERPALRLEIEGAAAQSSDGPLLAERRLEREYQNYLYRIMQRRGDQVPANAEALVVPDDEKAPLLEGIYRARLKQQPPAEWATLDDEERTAKLHAAVLASWSDSRGLQRLLAQQRAAAIKDYLVDHDKLADERIYLLDVNLGQAEPDGRVATPLHLGSE